MAERLQFDLVAVGGGFAGLCAALRGAELGLRTAIVEAGAVTGIYAVRAGPAASSTSHTMT
jgi:succinate dehydrogenase/fumarate reductase flavoprotein subunit